jgi:hypothetical protein
MKTPWQTARLTTMVLSLLPIWGVCRGATFTVTTTSDDGPGSLRQEILTANAAPGLDTIAFDIPGTGPFTIQPLSALPTITDPLVIDGYTQPGASPNSNPFGMGDNAVLMIELDGSHAGQDPSGLVIAAGGSTVSGLVINRFALHGIMLTGNGTNIVAGNFIGTDVTGTVALGNGWSPPWPGYASGVYIDQSPPGKPGENLVGGATPEARNLISGNPQGVEIGYSDGNRVMGNFIGTDVTGTKAIPNTEWAGVMIQNNGQNNYIGAPGAGNLISGNDGIGVFNCCAGTAVIEGNLIGTDVTGTVALGNQEGVVLNGDGGVIGGTAAGAGNVISGNKYDGLALYGSGYSIQGNLIGTDLRGTGQLGNGVIGFDTQASFCLIGGTVPGARNVISGNGAYGLEMILDSAHDNVVQGNFIGPDITGTIALGNGTGIYLGGSCSNNLIGGDFSRRPSHLRISCDRLARFGRLVFRRDRSL